MSAVLSIFTGLIVLGLYSAFIGTVHVGSVILGIILFNSVRATLRATEEKVEHDDERDS